MSSELLNVIMGGSDGGLKIHIFDSRYSHGFVSVMTKTSEQAAEIQDQFVGGDMDYIAIDHLRLIKWFPIVYTENVLDAVNILLMRITGIFTELMISNNPHDSASNWYLNVELLGNIVEKGRTDEIVKHITELNTLKGMELQNFLFELRDKEITK